MPSRADQAIGERGGNAACGAKKQEKPGEVIVGNVAVVVVVEGREEDLEGEGSGGREELDKVGDAKDVRNLYHK